MTPILRFYTIMEQLEDDERIASYLIAEHCKCDPKKVYKHLLNGRFERYLNILEEAFNNIEDIEKYCKDTIYKAETSRDSLLVNNDFENIGE